MARVHTIFDCKHEREIEVSIESDVVIPPSIRGLGKCPECKGERETIAIAGVASQPGGERLVLDSVLMMPVESPPAEA